jgi:hypothetical protein
LVSSNSGFNLLLGNSPGTRSNVGVNVDLSAYQSEAEGLGEIARDRYFRMKAIQFVRSNPREAAKLYCLKVLNYFNFRNELATRSEASPMRDYTMLLTYGPLLAMFCIRCVACKRWPFSAWELLLVALYLGNAIFSGVFFTRIRFRIPFDIVPLLFASTVASRVILLRCRDGGMGKR